MEGRLASAPARKCGGDTQDRRGHRKAALAQALYELSDHAYAKAPTGLAGGGKD